MTIDERLEAMARNLELMILETEKHDHQIAANDRLINAMTEKHDRQVSALLGQAARQDARLDRVGERLDALTQSLQLLAMQTEKHDNQIKQTTLLVNDVAEGTARLLRVVEAHEHRLDSHDDRLDNLA
jgi:ABC-type transporter Mla subunit MlaD